MRSTLAVFMFVLLVGALISPDAAWAPTAVEYSAGPIGLTRGQTAEMKCQNNFAPGGAQIRLSFVDPSDPSGLLAGGKVVDVPFHGVATLDLNADEVGRDLAPGQRLGLVGVIEIVTGPGSRLMEEDGLLPGASLQVFDNDTGRTALLVIAIRTRSKSR